jgi:hypothetical protein
VTLRVSGDHNAGDPQFQLFVDGKQVGGTYGVQAVFSSGQWQEISVPGSIDPSVAHKVEVKFVNDLSGEGGVGEGFDRNLFVDWIEVGGTRYEGERAGNTAALGYEDMVPTAAVMLANGTLTFTTKGGAAATVQPSPEPLPPGSTTTAPEATASEVTSLVPMGTTGSTTDASASATTSAAPADAEAAPASTGLAKYFASDSLWNTPVPDNPQLASNSSAIAAMLDQSGFGFQLNQSAWAVNVAVAPPGTPRTSVHGPDWTIDNVPITPDSYGTKDSDGHLVIIDQELGKIWNFMGAGNLPSDHQATAGGVFDIDGSGWWDPNAGGGPWTGRSSNASYLGGLILPEELKAGAIHHALAVGVDVSLMSDSPAKPALTTDANGVPGGVPNGTRLQLDPNLDLDSLGLGREARIVAEALQEYGAFVIERTSGFALYFQSNQNLPSDPYASMNFSGLDQKLHDHWQVVAPQAPKSYDSMETQSSYIHKVMMPFE